MRDLINRRIWITILVVGGAVGSGCNALPEPMPLFDLGQTGMRDMASLPSADVPTKSMDAGLADMGMLPPGDANDFGDSMTDGIQDGITLGDGADDATSEDGASNDFSSDAFTGDGGSSADLPVAE